MILNTAKSTTNYRCGRGATALTAILLLFGFEASATENGGSVWPAGAESVAMASAVPRAGQTWFYWYTTFYFANELDDSHGTAVSISDFKLRVFANAPVVRNLWGVGKDTDPEIGDRYSGSVGIVEVAGKIKRR